MDDDSRVEGKVVIEDGATVERSGDPGTGDHRSRARIVHAYVGPFVSS